MNIKDIIKKAYLDETGMNLSDDFFIFSSSEHWEGFQDGFLKACKLMQNGDLEPRKFCDCLDVYGQKVCTCGVNSPKL